MTRRPRILLLGLSVVAVTWVTQKQVAAKTDVTVDGSTVTLTVPIDILGAIRADTGNEVYVKELDTDLSKYWAGAATVWNDAFAKLSYSGCVHFKLDLQFFPKYRNATPTPGHHPVWFDNHPDVRSMVYDPETPNDPTKDTTSAFTSDLEANWGPVPDTVISHEVGHLLGLGDDYHDVKDANGKVTSGEAIKGREGTLMAESRSQNIDQNIVDRIGKLVEKAGKQLPTCWRGTWHQDSNRSYRNNTTGAELMKCDDAWDGTVSFAERSDGVLDGTAVAKLTSGFSCAPDQGRSSVERVKEIAYAVNGRKTDTGFELHFKWDHNTPKAGVNWGGNQMLLGLHMCDNAEAEPPPVLLDRRTADNVASGRFSATGSPLCGGSAHDVLGVDTHLEVTRQ